MSDTRFFPNFAEMKKGSGEEVCSERHLFFQNFRGDRKGDSEEVCS
jgi:hypothetical protein